MYMIDTMTRPAARRSLHRAAGAARSLDDLARRIGVLWGVEPHVSPVLRRQLFEDLHQLDADIERLVVRSAASSSVSVDELRSCQQRFLWLRERWMSAPLEAVRVSRLAPDRRLAVVADREAA
jgi:hypothetical protein